MYLYAFIFQKLNYSLPSVVLPILIEPEFLAWLSSMYNNITHLPRIYYWEFNLIKFQIVLQEASVDEEYDDDQKIDEEVEEDD